MPSPEEIAARLAYLRSKGWPPRVVVDRAVIVKARAKHRAAVDLALWESEVNT